METNQPAKQPHKSGSYRGLWLVVAGLVMAAFSAYMLTASVQQVRRTSESVEQTRLLRRELDVDHIWQLHHHALLEHLERMVRAAVLRKEALIRGALKKQYGWSDADIDAAIRSESPLVPDDGGNWTGKEPPPA